VAWSGKTIDVVKLVKRTAEDSRPTREVSRQYLMLDPRYAL
jgi:hypothetical protein